MIGVQFKRFSGEYKVDCESCGNDLRNDMSDEYCKFVDLGK